MAEPDAFESRASEILRLALGADVYFREQQLEAIRSVVVDRSRLLVVQRTGWGKSVVYFIATKLLRDAGAGPTIIVSPLLALMRDQIAAAERIGLRAATINSSNDEDWDTIERDLLDGEIDVLLISPERLNNVRFRDRILVPLAQSAGLLVIDEAHCISDWGHDFRPDYRRIVKILDLMPAGVPVLCTTATANDRVIDDVTHQLGDGLRVYRGSLDRESLSLAVLRLDSQADRLAWLAAWVPTVDGAGIVYCLTVADTQRVADWLVSQGIEAVAYAGETDPEARLDIERRLRENEVKVVAATSALGMGFDKPDLAFVVHFQSPSSPIAYYQQVGRAGRAISHADGILLVGSEDEDIWDYFLTTSLPLQWQAEDVVEQLELTHDWTTTGLVLEQLNIPQGRLAGLLKVLEVEGAVEHEGTRYRRTLAPWAFDAERFERVRQARLREQQAMRDYAATTGCRMQFLRRALDDPLAEPCGRCDNCQGKPPVAEYQRRLVRAAAEFVRHRPATIEPRARWMGADGGAIPVEQRLQPGRALGRTGDSGWGHDVLAAKHAHLHVDDDVVEAAAALVRDWLGDLGATVVPVPTRDPQRDLVPDFAARVAAALGWPLSTCVEKVRDNQPQKLMENSAQQLANVRYAFAVRPPVPGSAVLLVDDVSDSRWTMTVVGSLLAKAGAGAVYPFAIAKSKG